MNDLEQKKETLILFSSSVDLLLELTFDIHCKYGGTNLFNIKSVKNFHEFNELLKTNAEHAFYLIYELNLEVMHNTLQDLKTNLINENQILLGLEKNSQKNKIIADLECTYFIEYFSALNSTLGRFFCFGQYEKYINLYYLTQNPKKTLQLTDYLA